MLVYLDITDCALKDFCVGSIIKEHYIDHREGHRFLFQSAIATIKQTSSVEFYDIRLFQVEFTLLLNIEFNQNLIATAFS